MSESADRLGVWIGSDFASTASRYRGLGSDTDAPDEVRFLRGVTHLVLQRRAEAERLGEHDRRDIAIFILHDSPSNAIDSSERIPMLKSGLTELQGRLWCTAAPVVAGHFTNLPTTSDDERFSYVTDVLKLGSRPTVIFDTRPTLAQLWWYAKGLEHPDDPELKSIAGEVMPSDVFEAIDLLHETCFITPGGLPQGVNLWANSDRHWARRDAEALIQSHMKAGLSLRFPYCTVRQEQSQVSGRTDLEIEQGNPADHGSVTRYAILELKVLRSFGSTGRAVTSEYTDKWIESGIEQAAAYRIEKEARWSALCCFDMRLEDLGHTRCFESVRGMAECLYVRLGRWYLYASQDDYRRSLTG